MTEMRRVHIAVQIVQELQDLRDTVRTRPARIMKKLQRVSRECFQCPGPTGTGEGGTPYRLGSGDGGAFVGLCYIYLNRVIALCAMVEGGGVSVFRMVMD